MHIRGRLCLALLLTLVFQATEAGAACRSMLMPAAQLKTVGRGIVLVRGEMVHTGIDLLAPHGSLVRAAAPGRVIFVGRWYGYGNMVDVEHPDGVVTRYAHLSRFAAGIQPGATVRVGALLGAVGATGRATTAHLHFEVRIDGRPVDPRPNLALAACARPPAEREPLEEARAPDRSRGG
ncbi:M23 family metallopeptidase [Rhodovastum atsumiense]|uniref:M23 family metallopeptidase n=1 Tax=Rhodovastum atsumiense TaxID=504468 RepID=A0A5M6IT05_9PROT|nr:M23 family metallopeptidase [Rhodovastum atsumiense]KAA5610575.1 M23 family metallopeptidase [Rhodovastum atsumiense]CAH2600686.1 M23 family metallopeptidase [Rhodovastum atsumiense]